MRTFALLAVFLAVSLASNSFKCDFTMRSPSMTNGGFVNGVMKYDFNNKQLLNSYTSSGSQELYLYNAAGGYSGAKPYDAQFEFSWGSACTACNTAGLSEVMPILFQSSTYLTATGTPISSASPMASVTFDSRGYPAVYTRKDGKVFTYSNCADATFQVSTDFNKPSDCTCGKPINVVLVLDRSSSIDKTEFGLEKQFTQNLVAGFTYSPTGVNLGITNFHTVTWDGPVALTQGNNEASVTAGASALQCAPDPQCVVFSSAGTCCGMGTSISSGIVNGADMLATASQTGFRASAANVMIVLTDGYHNRVLKKTGGVIDRSTGGKPSGNPLVVGGQTCSEAGEAACKAGLLADLDEAVAYAVAKVARLQILAVGVGTVWDATQLLHIANNVQANVFGTDDWNKLNGLVDDLVSMTCQGGAVTPCTGCCGFCSCAGCSPVDGCSGGNFCDSLNKVGNCCNAVAKPPNTCDKPDKCFSYTCDRTAAGGVGACAQTVKPVTPNTPCASYACDPATGTIVFTDLCPPQPQCRVDTDCNDNKKCTTDKCVIPNPADIMSAFCQTTAITCTGTKCYTSACDPATGTCAKTFNPLPADNTCTTFKCDDAAGIVPTQTGACTTTPLCATPTDCDDKNFCNDDKCVLAVPTEPRTAKCVYTAKPSDFCNIADKCVTRACVPATGCVSTPIPIPADTTCNKYTCDPATGIVITPTGLCSPTPLCTLATDCDDKNACTDNACVLAVPTEPRTAKCVYTPKPADFCNIADKCVTRACVPATGCVSTPIAIPADTTCLDYSCDPAQGIVSVPTGLCTTLPVCTLDTDCDDKNFCNDDKCVLSVPTEPRTAKCVYTPKPSNFCDSTDKCVSTACVPATGCVTTPNPIPPATTCTTYTCDPATGVVATPTGLCTDQPVCTVATETGDCVDNNACTDDVCILAVPTEPLTAFCQFNAKPTDFCVEDDLCFTYSCDPTTGCVKTPVPVPEDTTCTDYSCDPAKGIVDVQTGACSSTLICTVATQSVDCDDGDACTTDECVLDVPTEPLTGKCVFTAKLPGFCDKPDLCFTYKCDPLVGCVEEPVPVPDDVVCTTYECDPASGIVPTDTGLCSTSVICTPPTASADCDDGNACTVEECILTDPTEPLTASCKSTQQELSVCEKPDMCFTYHCDPTTGCVETPVPVPDDTTCLDYSCDPAAGIVSVDTGACSATIQCEVAEDCNDGNMCTTEECVLAVPTEPLTASCVRTDVAPNSCDDPTNLCKTYRCDPLVGCVSEDNPVPLNSACTSYLCNPATGLVESTDLCPPLPACLLDETCNDGNACTEDKCVMSDPLDPLTSQCVWLPIATCDDLDACTIDTCDTALGCVYTPVAEDLCNDNDACTTDSCDPKAADPAMPCVNTPIICPAAEDVCHNSTCDKEQGCLILDIQCPTTDNCTISGCNTTRDQGCYVKDAGTCGFPVGIVAGIAGAVVGGIVVAAVAGALLVGGGAAYAFTAGPAAGFGASAVNNPLYSPAGTGGANPLNKK